MSKLQAAHTVKVYIMELPFATGESHKQVTTLTKEHETFLKEADKRDLTVTQQVAIKGCLISNLGPPIWKVNALSIAPRRLILKSHDKLIIFNSFAHELLPVDAV